MTMQEWVTIFSQGAGALIAIVAIITTVKKFLRKHHSNLLSGVATLIQTVAHDAGVAVEDVAKMPGAGAIKATMGAEILSVEDQLRNSRILQVAGTALHGFEKSLSALTENEKGTLVQFVGAELKRIGIDIPVGRILTALNEAQGIADRFKATPVYKNTVALDASIAAMKQATSS